MTSMSSPDPAEYVKLMLIGDSGAGKTGALASLAAAGYKLRIVDLDDGTKPLRKIMERDHPEALANIEYLTFRDKYKATPQGMSLVMPAKAYLNATRTLDKWDDDTRPSEWGHDYIYIWDSLTLGGIAAKNQAQSLSPTTKDPRQWFFAAQNALENLLAVLYGPDFCTNVIVMSHITDIAMADGTSKGFPTAIGKALSRHIAKYLNDLFIVESKGTGTNVKRVIRTVPNGNTVAKSSALTLEKELPIETGLATIFSALKNV
jgi:hypothetical protein